MAGRVDLCASVLRLPTPERNTTGVGLVLAVYTVLGLLGIAFGYLMVHLKWIAWAATGD